MIFGEDIAALIGLVLALIAVLATIITGNPLYDALGSIAIGVVLVIVAIALAIEIKGLMIGQSAEPETEAAIRRFLEERQEVASVLRLITLQLGGSLMVAVKAQMRDSNAKDMVASINRTEVALRAAFPDIQWLFFSRTSSNKSRENRGLDVLMGAVTWWATFFVMPLAVQWEIPLATVEPACRFSGSVRVRRSDWRWRSPGRCGIRSGT